MYEHRAYLLSKYDCTGAGGEVHLQFSIGSVRVCAPEKAPRTSPAVAAGRLLALDGPPMLFRQSCTLSPPAITCISNYANTSPRPRSRPAFMNSSFIELQRYIWKDEKAEALPSSPENKGKWKAERKLQAPFLDENMKFSHSIQFNAVPDWSSHYIAYSNLKKL